MGLTRRQLMGLSGAVAFTAMSGCGTATSASRTPARPYTVAQWRSERSAPYYIGHRGAGAVVPEHTLESYQQALDWGAKALEISVVISSDGELYCLHDTTLERVTTLSGPTIETPSQIFDRGRVNIPRLGPRWGGSNAPAIPRLSTVLDSVGGRAVLCIEAKDGRALQPMLAMLATRGLTETVVLKAHVLASALETARRQGLPMFAYMGSKDDLKPANLAKLKDVVDPSRDVVVIPARAGGAFVDPSFVRECVKIGPVWAFSATRRAEVEYYRQLGLEGFVTPNLAYLAGATPGTTMSWDSGELTAGTLTADPYADVWGVGWDTENAITLQTNGEPCFVTLGDISPVANPTSFAASFQLLVREAAGAVPDGPSVLFGADTDGSVSLGHANTGYRAVWGFNGELRIERSHDDVVLARTRVAPPAVDGVETLTIRVAPESVSVGLGQTQLAVRDSKWRGGYLHFGRTGTFGRVALRKVDVSQ